MKTLNFYLFLLTALLCGALFCTDSQARVCFATDPDCGNGGNFGNMDDLKQYDDACKNYGYTYENSCPAEYIKYICPYKSTWLKCCGKQFRYEGCIYPLEIDKSQVGDVVDGVTQYGKCGTRYACKCPDEYEISSEYAETNNCQPGGGYCLQSDGTTDTVKYKTCTCDEDIYTDISSCKNNQTETSSCKDAKGTVRKKCHCDRGVYPYAACEYGPSIGAKTCIDSNSGREYYSRCKTAEEACREEGFEYNECSLVKNCEHETLTKKVKTTCAKKILGVCVKWNYEYVPETSDNCILGPACPYPVNPGLYKCVFDKASWCTSRGYTSTMTTKPTEGAKCTTSDGYEGKYSVCPANDNQSLFYYRCKLPCKTEVRRMAAQNYLVPDVNIVNDEGVAGFYRQVGGEKHLYIIGDVVLPQATTPLNTKGGGWGNIGSKIDYASINGMWALYEVDPVRYESCGDERDNWDYLYDTYPDYKEYKDRHRPIIKFDGMLIHAWSRFLSKNMSDINIEIYSSNKDNPEGFGEEYNIASGSSLTWKNVTISERVRAAKLCSSNYQGSYYPRRDDCKGGWHGTLIKIDSGAQITFTGKPYFNITASSYGGCGSINCRGGWASSDCPSNQWWCPADFDQYQTNKSYPMATTRFHWNGNAKAVFKDAEIYSNPYTDWDGAGGQNAMFFYNSKGTMGRVWSTWNIGLDNSDITFNMLRINAYQSANNTFGGYSDLNHGRYRCHGVYVTNGSKLKFINNYARIQSHNAKIYLDWNTELSSEYPIVFGGSTSDMICVDSGAKATINGKSYSGKAMIYGSGSSLQAGNNATVMTVANRWNNNLYTTCTGKCKKNSYTKDTCSGYYNNGKCFCDTGDGHNYAYYPSWQGTAFCTSCQTCEVHGMGY